MDKKEQDARINSVLLRVRRTALVGQVASGHRTAVVDGGLDAGVTRRSHFRLRGRGREIHLLEVELLGTVEARGQEAFAFFPDFDRAVVSLSAVGEAFFE